MKKEIQILGLNMANYSLREELAITQEAFADHRLFCIMTASMQNLLLAGTSQAVKDCIEQADLIIVDDAEILRQGKIYSSQRNREIDEQLFVKEFLKRVIRSEKKVFVVAQTQEDADRLKKFLGKRYEKLQIAGQYNVEDCPGNLDHLINEINSASADAVLSVLPSPLQEEFLNDARSKIDARVWYGLGKKYDLQEEQKTLWMRIRYWVHRRWFKLHVNNYQETDDDEKNT